MVKIIKKRGRIEDLSPDDIAVTLITPHGERHYTFDYNVKKLNLAGLGVGNACGVLELF